MKFGSVALAEAAGAVLAHTARVAGRVLGKGLVLDGESLGVLAAAGWQRVVVARLEPGDVDEDAAAARVAAAVAGPGLDCVAAGTGRVNLVARAAGLFRADRAMVDALNGVDEGLTVGCLADAVPVAAGEMVATIKVIPFAVAGAAVARLEAVARAGFAVAGNTGALGGLGSGVRGAADRAGVVAGSGAAGAPGAGGRAGWAMRVAGFRPLRVGLVVSTLPGLKASVIEGTIRVTGRRVAGLGGSLLGVLQVAHEVGAVSGAFAGLLAQGAELLLLAGASAVVDRGDVGPAAMVAAGGVVEQFGMPVDPGNLICIGRVGAVPAVVLPGCARSPRLNGIDLVLRLVFAGEPAGRAAVAGMGVGGLLKDAVGRPHARAGGAALAEREPGGPVAAVVLAAGLSARMAPRNKLLVEDGAGVAMAARVVAACVASRAAMVVVVLGHQADAVEAAVRAAVGGGVVGGEAGAGEGGVGLGWRGGVAVLAGGAEGVGGDGGAAPGGGVLGGAAGAGRVRFVRAAGYADGMSASLRAGLAALGDEVAAVLVCLGDMPLVGAAAMDAVMGAYCPEEGRLIVVPVHGGKRGNPVLWDRRYFAEMAGLSGDVGARGLLRVHAGEVAEIEAGEGVLVDFDTAGSLGVG